MQYDFTPEQYEALIKLTATLSKVFPKTKCDYPHDAQGNVILKKLPDQELNNYQGVLGHFHIQTNKTDPGPAFQWNYVIGHALPIPPVASTTDFALKTTKRPFSRQYANAPATRPPSISSRVVVHSM